MTGRHLFVPLYLALCLLLGGASAAGFAANLLLQIVAIPLIAWSIWSLPFHPVNGAARALLILTALLVVICVLQLVPLPPSVWTALPGRESVAKGYALLSLPLPWLPISLAPTQSLASLLWLLPAFAVLLMVTVVGAFRARWIAWTICAVTALSVALGALQIVGGSSSGAYLYRITNFGASVGFFANSNHEATLLLVSIPFIAALRAQSAKRNASRRSMSAIAVMTTAAFVVVAVGLLTNFSLAGLGLAAPVAATSFLLIGTRQRSPRPWMFVTIALLSLAAIATVIIGPFKNNLFGVQTAYADLSRQTSFARTLTAAREYLPFGSGLGSFQPIYRTQEPVDQVTTTYMNHAHSDWIELLLETGLVGMSLVAAFLVWWVRRVLVIWHADQPDYYARAAVIATAAIMLHSLVDYPLRTAALSAVFAACLALMSGVRPFAPRTRKSASARHMSVTS